MGGNMKLTREELIELWLIPYHGLTVKELIEKEPAQFLKTDEWFKKYAVTKQQHDDWYDAAIKLITKRLRTSQKAAKRWFTLDYLDIAPSVNDK